jgi:mannose/cellobiose epimerase-like protein (N-acyl-D-glucosamine 2-epimerase family)
LSAISLTERARQAKIWLFDVAFPLWAGRGFDSQTGLFQEKLDASLHPSPGPRRVRVQARQTYVFALAGRLGWTGPWRERVEAGFATLNGPARGDAGAVGHLLDARGRLMDARRDLYDQAFALFACAHAASVVPLAQKRAQEIADFIDKNWKSPCGGYLEGEVEPPLPRRQNPHMHLLEAALAMHAATAAPRWRSLGEQMMHLFAAHFYDPAAGVLREFFDAELKPAPGDAGDILEPGHHFEWCWLLARWADSSGADTGAAAERLYAFARTHGIAAHGAAMDEIVVNGGARMSTARLWPQTEWLKAALVRYEQGGDADDIAIAHDVLTRYLDQPAPGLWRDRMREDGAFIDEPAPASSFYHIVLALAELIRVAEV